MTQKRNKSKIFLGFIKLLAFLSYILKTKRQKLFILEKFYAKKYQKQERRNSDTAHIPYFLRAKDRIKAIIKTKTINLELIKILRSV